MRRVAVGLAFALVAAGVGGTGAENVAVAQIPPRATAVLALVAAYNGSRLAWLDPATLRPLAKGSVALPGGAWGPVFSPAGRYVALGGSGSVGIRIVDLRRMKLVAHVARRSSYRRVTPLAWPERRRLLALDSPTDAQGATDSLLAIDPVERQIVGRTVRASSARAWRSWTRVGRELLALSQPVEEIGALRLVVFGSDAGIQRAKDVGIVGGVFPEHGDGTTPEARVQSPALAVDPSARRAFVVDSLTIASIDLETLEASYARLSEPRSLAARLLAWLEPTAQAKVISGYSRDASWLGEERLVVSGSVYDGLGRSPTGLQLVDVRSGAIAMLEPRTSAHRFAQGVVLAFGGGYDAATSTWSGMGLSAFNTHGAGLWSALGDEPIGWVEVAGGYAYIPTPEETFPAGVRVIDLATGAVLRTVRGELPTFLADD